MKEQIKTILKKLGLYYIFQSNYRALLASFIRVKNKLSYSKYKGSGFTCNFCGAVYQHFVPDYPTTEIAEAINSNKVVAGYGENVFCPNCMSKNRERLVKVALDNFLEIENKKILHFSPEKKVFNYIKNKARVTTVDISPAFYKNIDASIKFADATKLDFDDKSFDIIMAKEFRPDKAVFEKVSGIYSMSDKSVIEFYPDGDLLFMKWNGQIREGLRYKGGNEFIGGTGNRAAKFDVQPDGKVKVTFQFITALKKENKEYKEHNLEGIKTFKY